MRSTSLLRLRAAAVLLACASAVTAAWAEPEGDPVTRLLMERGLIDAPAQTPPADTGLRAQVREAASDMVLTAMNFLGVPYKRGGTTAETGFDCSGFTRHIFENSLGLVLPRRADEQAHAPGFLEVKRDELKPGDLVFFNTLRRTFSHVGIYVGEGKFIHSPRAGGKVRIEDMRFAYWASRFTGARRPSNTGNTPADSSNTPTTFSSAVFPPGLLLDTPTDNTPAPQRPQGPRATSQRASR
jgi:cell wall-associated NlpC family hydrolase